MSHKVKRRTQAARTGPIRVVLSGDHDLVRACLRALLDTQPDIKVIGEAGAASATVDLVAQTSPNVVVMDLVQPRGGGIDAIRRIASKAPSVRIVVLTALGDAQFLTDALSAGAAGYLMKTCGRNGLLNAIRSVAAGGVYLSPEASSILVKSCRASRAAAPSAGRPPLMARECAVLALLAEGLGSKAIAGRLGVSTRTVAKCRAHISEKTALRSIAELTKYAIAEGLTAAEVGASAWPRR